jgi:hypothetical protein
MVLRILDIKETFVLNRIKELEQFINEEKPESIGDFSYNSDLEITYVYDKQDFTYDYPLDDYSNYVCLSEAEPTKEIQFEDNIGEGGAIFVDDDYNIIAYIFNVD